MTQAISIQPVLIDGRHTFAELLELCGGDMKQLARTIITAADRHRVIPGAAGTTILYRWLDAWDRLLYIGITDNLGTRLHGHARGSSWMDFAASSTIERWPTRKSAAREEIAAIKAELPIFNYQHNDTPEARERLVAYLVEFNRLDLLVPAVSRG